MTTSGTADTRPPSVVTAADSVLRAVADELRADGWSVAESWQLPETPWDLSDERRVCVGTITTTPDLVPVILAAVRGVVVVVRCEDESLRADAVDELERVTATEERDDVRAAVSLSDEQRRLLELLGGGATMADAAAELFLSMRTVERRLAQARKALGVATTAEAIVAYRHSD